MTCSAESSDSKHVAASVPGNERDPVLTAFDADCAAAAVALENTLGRFVPRVLQKRLPMLVETLGAKPWAALWRCSAAVTRKCFAIRESTRSDLVKDVLLLLSIKSMQFGNFSFERALSMLGLVQHLVKSGCLAREAERQRLQAQEVFINAAKRDVDLSANLRAKRIACQLYARLRRLIGPY